MITLSLGAHLFFKMKYEKFECKKKIPKLIIKYLNNKEFLKIFNEFKTLNSKNKYAVAISGGPLL